MSDSLNCPHCSRSLVHSEIPEYQRCSDSCDRDAEFETKRKDRNYKSECLSNHHYGPAKHFMKTIGVEVSGTYDGVLYWMCPDCEGKWHRWPEGSAYHEAAKEYVDGNQ